MFLSNFSIKQPVTTIAIVIVLMCLGLLALKNLRVNQIPGRRKPGDGRSPSRIPARRRKRWNAKSSIASRSRCRAFRRSTKSSRRRRRATPVSPSCSTSRRTCRRPVTKSATPSPSVRYKLPIEMREPVLFRVDPSAEPIMDLGLSSTRQTHAEISRLAEDVLADQLRGIDGVSVVNVDGALQRELSVLLHAQKLREYNVSAGEVVNALRAQNTNAPVGRVKGELDEQNIRLVGRIERRASSTTSSSSGRATRSCASARSPPSKMVSPSRAVTPCATASPTSACRSFARARRARCRSPTTMRKQVEEINKTLPEGTKLEVTRDGGDEASSRTSATSSTR